MSEDCAAVGFSGEGRCIEPASVGNLCDAHANLECRHTELPDTNWTRLRAAEESAQHRQALLRAVLAFVDGHHVDLPCTLLEQLRTEAQVEVHEG